MDNSFDNVRDSSIWYKPSSLNVLNNMDNRLYVGVVRQAFNDEDTNELRYLVEVYHKNDTVITNCRMMRRFGGAFNYEDNVMQGYNFNDASNNENGVAALAGDVVLVGQFGGQGRDGIIIGSLTHPARSSFLDVSDGPQYRSEFNGIETFINKDGEYILTFKGQPTNLDVLDNEPSDPIPDPEYDTDVGTSYLKWDKTGSFTVDDNATDSDGNQKIFIDKANGVIEIDSGKISIKMTKSDQSVVWQCKTWELDADDSVTIKTKDTEIDTQDSFTLKTKDTEVDSQDSITMKTGSYEITANDHTKYTTQEFTVISPAIYLGSDSLIISGIPNDGVVTGVGIDTFTGQPYSALGNASSVVFAKKA